MSHLSMNEVTTYRWSFEEDIAQYAAAGIEAIGVWRQKLADFGEEKGIELIAESGLRVSNLLWAGGFTGTDGRTFVESVEDGLEAIRLAAELKAGCLVLYSGSRGNHTLKHARRLVHNAVCEMLPAAEAMEVTLAIEPMHPGCAAEWTFFTTLDAALELIDEISNPRLKLAFDTYHFGREETVRSRLADIVPQIAVVHLGDSKRQPKQEQDRCRLGDGSIRLKEIIEGLCAAGYGGDYDVELIGEEIETADYRGLLEHSKQAFAQLSGAWR